jgi:hypothetical protein
LLPAALIAITIALATLALFVAAIIIHRTLLLFIVAHHRGHVLACHHPPFTIPLLVDCCHYPTLPILRDPPTEGGGGHIGEPVKSPLLLAGWCIHGKPKHGNLMVGKAGTRMSYWFPDFLPCVLDLWKKGRKIGNLGEILICEMIFTHIQMEGVILNNYDIIDVDMKHIV